MSRRVIWADEIFLGDNIRSWVRFGISLGSVVRFAYMISFGDFRFSLLFLFRCGMMLHTVLLLILQLYAAIFR